MISPSKRSSTVVSTTSLKKYKTMGAQRINQYIVQRKLGEGSFATVKLCEDSGTHIKYAMKIMNKENLKKMVING
jgi:serine/threonine protein kinase